MPNPPPTVLILGAGVHGAAIARDLVLNGVGVHVVDRFDIAFGATSKSSRLIHGGLRYLEYGDFKLVKESLEAREQNLRLAPQFVRPLRLYIPTSERFTGLVRSAVGFFGLSRTSLGQSLAGVPGGRGFWPMRTGLAMYDSLSQASSLPKSATMPVNAPGTPRVNPRRYHWLCAYSDAQMVFPERLVLALLAEAQQIAAANGIEFQVSTYAQTRFDHGVWRITPSHHDETPLSPACVINATGAWGDETLRQLGIPSPPQFGGTKGSHFVTWNEQLRDALQGQAVYAEADDGRLVFVLPFHGGTLVGTTDETFAAAPESACATAEELDYLLQLVNGVMDVRLTRADITLHYSGVRPLPISTAGNNAAVSRDHAVSVRAAGDCPVFTLVGGKLTTWSQFATEVSDRVLSHLRQPRRKPTADLPVPGAIYAGLFDSDGNPLGAPLVPEGWVEDWSQVSAETDAGLAQFAALVPLYGCRALDVLRDCRGQLGSPIRGTDFTTGIVQWIIDREWVRTLSDLVERRLMLVFVRELKRETLIDLADCLVAAGKLSAADVPREIAATIERLKTYYGRRIDGESLGSGSARVS